MPGLKDEASVAVGNLRAEEMQELGVSRMGGGASKRLINISPPLIKNNSA